MADMFIKIDGIAGESQDATHSEEIDVIDWTWKVTQQSSMMSGSGGGAARASVSDLEFTHQLDRATPNLARYCFTGKHIPQARLVMRKAGGIPHEYLRITMYDVIISHVEPFADANGAIECVRLSFARMKKEYILQNALGGVGGTITTFLDVRENVTK
ncbi:type VI secretion system tube protein Hcp [Caballeronia sp. J97]|uniref:Hcp family type VI secretion system effector n=1 Tax=Caballeronia sp. J97 TaxID=2805429 RepID=UPI002AAF6B38|nr:type VI secretion system tube protein Hcp [Caballeronia sp. J97]